MEEFIWWVVPCTIIIALAVVTWVSTHALDPYKPLQSQVKPLVIQVVSLNWKWLFIYPNQNIATVNFLELPVGTPIAFQLTADAPMNSFLIPQLGGQIMAMPGMVTQLHLVADETGKYSGFSANFSGAGFSGMTFVANAVSSQDFALWVQWMQQRGTPLTAAGYSALAQPSEYNPVAYYSSVANGLYNGIVEKYMFPTPIAPVTPPSSRTLPAQMPAQMQM